MITPPFLATLDLTRTFLLPHLFVSFCIIPYFDFLLLVLLTSASRRECHPSFAISSLLPSEDQFLQFNRMLADV